METSKEFNLDERIDMVRQGKYSFSYLINNDLKEEVEKMFIEEYKNGTLPDSGYKELLAYELTKISRENYSIDNVPKEIRDKIEELINKVE